ncbi:hypothetical protein D3C87_1506270 [compost metagenome]
MRFKPLIDAIEQDKQVFFPRTINCSWTNNDQWKVLKISQILLGEHFTRAVIGYRTGNTVILDFG